VQLTFSELLNIEGGLVSSNLLLSVCLSVCTKDMMLENVLDPTRNWHYY